MIQIKPLASYKIVALLVLMMLGLSILPVASASSSMGLRLSNDSHLTLSHSLSLTADSNLKATDSYILTLPTGDKVIVTEFNGSDKPRIAIEGTHSINYKVFELHGHTYILPIGIDMSKFSPELFDIQVLKTYEVTYGLKELPIIVEMNSKVNVLSHESITSALPSLRTMSYKPLKLINSIAIRAPLKGIGRLFNNLITSKDVVKVMLDHMRRVAEVKSPDSTSENVKPELWESVPFIGAPEMWSAGFNGTGVKVAILDTGIDPTNPDFIYPNGTSKVVANRSFVDFDWDGVPDEPVQDGHGHGTHVAGIVGGLGNYLPFIKGVAPGASLIVGKVLSNEGWGYDDWIISGIEWAISEGADVISMSLGGPAYPEYDPLVDAVNQAFNQGVLVVVAAGNEGPSEFTISSPGDAENALTVGALDTLSNPPEIAWFSSVGPAVNGTVKPDVVAPGVDIASDRARGTYMDMPASYYHVFASGTSMATPHVSGYAALLLQYLRVTGLLEKFTSLNLTNSEILKDLIVSTSTDLWGQPLVYGAGVINATNFFNLSSNQELILVHPARSDLSIGNNFEKILVANPWNKTLTLKITPVIISDNPNVSIPQDAVNVTSNITLQPYGYSWINISVNESLFPTPGTYAVKLIFTDNDTGITSGQALIGVDMWRSLTQEPQSYITFNVNYNGKPVYADIAGMSYYDKGTGVEWEHYVSGEGNGTIVLGPLFGNSIYLLTLSASFNASAYNISADNAEATIELAVILPEEQLNTSVNIDLSNYPIFNVENPDGLITTYGVFIDYLINMTSLNQSTTSTDMFTDTVAGHATNAYIYGFQEINLTAPEAPLTGVDFQILGTNLDAKTQPIIPGIGGEFTTFEPIYGFLRYFTSLPKGTVTINPSTINYTITHIHSVISQTPLPEYSATAYWGAHSGWTTVAWPFGYTGSISIYYVDSNDTINLNYVMGADDVYIPTDESYLEMYFESWFPYTLSDSEAYVAPMTMPRGGTIWTYMYAYPGMDNYNYTGSFLSAHMYRTTLFGDLEMYAEEKEPLFTLNVSFNEGGFTYGWSNPNEPYILNLLNIWYNHTSVPKGTPQMEVSMRTNLSDFKDYLSFLSKKSSMTLQVTTNATYKDLPMLSVVYPGFGYGQGVRDILPLAGYDFLDNMVWRGCTAIFLVVFDESNAELLTDSVSITLIGSDGSEHEVPILGWTSVNGLPAAEIAIPSSQLPPDAYSMRVTGMYQFTTTGIESNATFTLEVSPSLYVGIPPGPRLTYAHQPIHIVGDGDFTPENGVICGDGSEANPYIIADWYVNATGAEAGVVIENTTAHFIIEDMTTTGGYTGILLHNVSNALILNSQFMNSSGDGVLLINSSNIYIAYSDIANNTDYGVEVGDDSSAIEIHYSNIYGNGAGGISNSINNPAVNASLNWWGDISGPSGKGYGSGDSVTGVVIYEPWLNAPYPEGVPVSMVSGGKSSTSLSSNTSLILNASSAGVEVYGNGSGAVEVSVMQYNSNPTNKTPYGGFKYIDVHINSSSGVSMLKIRIYYTASEIDHVKEDLLAPYLWDESTGRWVKCSDYFVNTTDQDGYAGYIEITITNTTTPSLNDLAGTVLGLGSTPPPVGGELDIPGNQQNYGGALTITVMIGSLAAALYLYRRKEA